MIASNKTGVAINNSCPVIMQSELLRYQQEKDTRTILLLDIYYSGQNARKK